MPDKLQDAISSIKAGDKERGKQLLIALLKEDQRNENAWLWMTKVVSTNAERVKCLQNVLKINPANQIAQRGLTKLQERQPRTTKKQSNPTPSKIKKRKTGDKTPVRNRNFAQALLHHWQSGPEGKLAIGCGTLVLLFCSCGFASFVVNSSLNIINERIQPASVQEVVVAEATNTPTATQPPPTDIPPTPTNALVISEPTSGEDFDAYAEEVVRSLDLLSQAIAGFEELSAVQESSKQEWIADVATHINEIRQAHSELAAITPPPELAQLHEAILDGTTDCNEATFFLASGIDNQNEGELRQAANLIASCSTKLTGVSDLAQQTLQEQSSTPVIVNTSTPIPSISPSQSPTGESDLQFGYTEAQRKTIFQDIIRAEIRADTEAKTLFPEPDPLGPNYSQQATKEALQNQFDYMDEQTPLYKREVAERYNLTEEQLQEIEIEGIKKLWPFPPLP